MVCLFMAAAFGAANDADLGGIALSRELLGR